MSNRELSLTLTSIILPVVKNKVGIETSFEGFSGEQVNTLWYLLRMTIEDKDAALVDRFEQQPDDINVRKAFARTLEQELSNDADLKTEVTTFVNHILVMDEEIIEEEVPMLIAKETDIDEQELVFDEQVEVEEPAQNAQQKYERKKKRALWIRRAMIAIPILIFLSLLIQPISNFITSLKKFKSGDQAELRVAFFPIDDTANQSLDLNSILKNKEKKQTGILFKTFNNIRLDDPTKDLAFYANEKNADLVLWHTNEKDSADNLIVRYLFTDLFSLYENKEDKLVASKLRRNQFLQEGILPNDINFISNWIESINAYKKGEYQQSGKFLHTLLVNSKTPIYQIQLNHDLSKIYSLLENRDKQWESALNMLMLAQDNLSKNDLLNGQANCLLGKAYADKQEFFPAAEYYNKAVEIMEDKLGLESLQLADLYQKQAEAHLMTNEVERAYSFSKRALNIKKRNLKKGDLSIAELYSLLGNVYNKRHDYNEALNYSMKALELKKALYPDNSPQLALAYNDVAIANQRVGDYAKVLEYQQKQLDLFKTNRDKNDPALARIYNNLAWTYFDLGEYNAALQYFDQAISIQKRHPNNVMLATIYNNKAELLNELERYEEALALVSNAFEIYEDNLDPNNLQIGRSYIRLGNTYAKLTNYDQSLNEYHKAKMFFEINPQYSPAFLGEVLMGKGTVYRMIGKWDTSKIYLEKARRIYEDVFPPKDINMTKLYSQLAMTYRGMGLVKSALVAQRRAINILKNLNINKSLKGANAYHNLALILNDTREYRQANQAIQKSITTLKQYKKEGLEMPKLESSETLLVDINRSMGDSGIMVKDY